ncbi:MULTISPECIES: hypothetical protein [Thermus]|uniref:hypothetical protein n=1 Tax=Thermus brockianus TaxID=56956 RepID=UPI001F39910A|nr:hypothetical protein [Thermus brockianus]
MRDLMVRPGIVVLTPGFLTIVDVDESVEQAVSARSDLFEMRVFGNSIYLRPTKRAGTTDLVVTAGGRVFMLRLVIDDKNFTTYRYRIRYPRQTEVPQGEMTPVTRGETKFPGEVREATLPLQVEFTLTKAGEGLLLEYRALNAGKNPVVLDPARLRVRGGGKDLSFRLLWREGAAVPGRLLPGETERGAFLVDSLTLPVEVSWSATEVGTGRTLVVGGKWSEVK